MSDFKRHSLECMLGRSLDTVQHCGCETPDGYCKLYPKPIAVFCTNSRGVKK